MAVKKKVVTAKISQGNSVFVHVNGNTAAHELAALRVMEEEGYDLTEWGLSDVQRENYDTDDYQIIFERTE